MFRVQWRGAVIEADTVQEAHELLALVTSTNGTQPARTGTEKKPSRVANAPRRDPVTSVSAPAKRTTTQPKGDTAGTNNDVVPLSTAAIVERVERAGPDGLAPQDLYESFKESNNTIRRRVDRAVLAGTIQQRGRTSATRFFPRSVVWDGSGRKEPS